MLIFHEIERKGLCIFVKTENFLILIKVSSQHLKIIGSWSLNIFKLRFCFLFFYYLFVSIYERRSWPSSLITVCGYLTLVQPSPPLTYIVGTKPKLKIKFNNKVFVLFLFFSYFSRSFSSLPEGVIKESLKSLL